MSKYKNIKVGDIIDVTYGAGVVKAEVLEISSKGMEWEMAKVVILVSDDLPISMRREIAYLPFHASELPKVKSNG